MSLNTYKPQDELTIRDILNILWKRKVWIIALVVIAVILSGALSLFVMKKEYRANATLSVVPKDIKPIALTEKITIDDPFEHLTKKVKADYVKGMLSPEVLTAVSGELGLDETPSALLSRISIRDVEKSNLVEISVTYTDPGTAEKIANALCGIVEKSVQTERQAEFADALAFAQGRLDSLKTALAEDTDQKDIFLDQHDVEAMMKEAVRLEAVADNYEDRLRTISRQISIDAAFVEALQEAYEGLGYVPAGNIEFDVSTSREVSSGGNRPNFEVSGDELSEALLVADYSAAHLRLVSFSLEKTALEAELLDIEARMDTIEAEVLAYSGEYDSLVATVGLTQSKIRAYEQRRAELAEYSGTEEGSGARVVEVISGAIAGTQPVSPNVMRNVLLAGALGLFLSLAVIYFKDVIMATPLASESEDKKNPVKPAE